MFSTIFVWACDSSVTATCMPDRLLHVISITHRPISTAESSTRLSYRGTSWLVVTMLYNRDSKKGQVDYPIFIGLFMIRIVSSVYVNGASCISINKTKHYITPQNIYIIDSYKIFCVNGWSITCRWRNHSDCSFSSKNKKFAKIRTPFWWYCRLPWC